MTDLFEGYFEELPGTAAWDEVFSAPDKPRPGYGALYDTLRTLSGKDLASRKAVLDRAFENAGITFDFAGREHPWPLDLVPRLLDSAEWDVIERGVRQRVRALEAFLADAYGAGEVFFDGVLPHSLVASSPNYRRAALGVKPPSGVRVHVAGIDLVRDEAGRFRVLEDNVRTPSGVSYVIENRHAMTKIFPDAFAAHRVRPVSDYAVHLLDALRATAPAGADDPTVVVLSPGIFNSAYFEHSLLARQMGVHLVEGRDLVVSDNRVYMLTTAGKVPVDVVYRRIDDDWLDPLHFRPESVIGCPGLLDAARARRVTLANAVGNGIADDKLVYTYVPDLIRYYLGEKPVLDNVETYRLEDPDQLAYVLDHLGSLVVKPVDGSGGNGIVIGTTASDAELAELRCQVVSDPRAWIAQRVVDLSTSPTLVDGRLAPRHVDLRPFALNDGSAVRVLPGGLTRVALPRGGLIVNSSQGGGSKDTWVLAPDAAVPQPANSWDSPLRRPSAAVGESRGARARAADGDRHGMLSRVAEALFWTGRYVERAELTARILDVHLQRVMEDPWLDEVDAGRALLDLVGLPQPDRDPDARAVVGVVAFDADHRSSVAGALGAARENARHARGVISSEVWECLNATWLDLPTHQVAAADIGPHVFFRHVRQRTAMLAGLIDATLPRDDGRRFLELGWHLERIDMTARLLCSCVADSGTRSSWVSLLRSCGAHEAFLRTYSNAADGPSVAEFMILDRTFPRSVYSSLHTTEVLLEELTASAGSPRTGLDDPALRAVGRARTGLQFLLVDEIFASLPEMLDGLQQACSTANDEITRRHFPQPPR